MDGAGGLPRLRRHSTKTPIASMPANRRDLTDASSSSLFLGPDDHYNNPERPAQRRRLGDSVFILPPLRHESTFRFPGDGLDHRRPVMSGNVAAAAPVIDLTEDDVAETSGGGAGRSDEISRGSVRAADSTARRGPRFGRDIIDMAEHHPQDEGYTFSSTRDRGASGRLRPHLAGLRRPARPDSPLVDGGEIEILREGPASRPPTSSRQPTPAATGVQHSDDLVLVDLTGDDDVVHLNTRPVDVPRSRTTEDSQRPSYVGIGGLAESIRGGRLYDRIRSVHRNLLEGYSLQAHEHHHQQHLRHAQPRAPFPSRPQRHSPDHPHMPPPFNFGLRPLRNFMENVPRVMDYAAVSFDMGVPGGNRPSSPAYVPPGPAEDGFTRNPGEDEVVVCPNCGDELAVGDGDEKQMIFVIKGCGHAYCGTCAKHRLRSTNKKGKGRVGDEDLPPAFKKCVVDNCGRSAAKSSMIQVFMGS